MARPLNARSQECIEACKQHLRMEGSVGWDEVKARFADLPASTFWRMVEHAKRQIEASAVTAQNPAALQSAQARIRTRIEAPKVTEARMKAHLPTAPSPAIIASMSGEQQDKVFDFFAAFQRVVRDADLLRSKAIRVDSDGRETVVNPNLLDNSIRRRLSIMETYLHAMSEVYNLSKLQELYGLVIEEVGKADPVVQQNILARLRVLNNQRGMTMAAQP